MPDRFREPSPTIGRPGWTRRQVLKMMGSVAPAALVPMTSSGQGKSQSQPAGQITAKSFTRLLNGAKIHVRQWGPDSAPPMLLLHPGMLNSHVWDSFAPVVASHFRVIAPDARGHRESEKPSGQAPPTSPPAPRHGGPPPIPAGPFTSPDDVAAQIPKAWGPAFTRAMIDHNLKRDSEGVWRWKCDLKKLTAAYERSVLDPRKRPLWRAVKSPTLVLRGGGSPAMSQQAAEQMIAENEHATLVVIAGAGHFIPLEAPSAFEPYANG